MDLYLCWHSNADRDIEAASLRNQPEIVRRINFGIEHATMGIESWVLTSGGSMVQAGGVDGQATVPADHLEELLDVLRRYQETTESSVACGIGAEPAEAITAMTVAQKRGGSPAVVLYTPDVAQEADEDGDGDLDPILPDEVDAMEGNQHVAAPTPGGSMTKAQFGNQPSSGEATKIAQGALSPSHAQPSAPSPIGLPPRAPQSQDPSGQQPPPPQQGGDDTGKLIQAVGQVLVDVKKQLPTLEGMKKENPAAYESMVALTQALVAVAQKLVGGSTAVQKFEAGLSKSEILNLVKRELKTISVEVDTREAESLMKLLEDIRRSANVGHSFTVVVDPNERGGGNFHGGRRYGIDGDGSFYIGQLKFEKTTKDTSTTKDSVGSGEAIGCKPGEQRPEHENENDVHPAFTDSSYADNTPDEQHPERASEEAMAAFKRGVEEEAREHPTISQAMCKRLVRDHLVIDSHYYDEEEMEKVEGAARPLKPTKTGRHVLCLPTGTQRDNRVKVVHADGSTSWVEVGAGQITSEDGHPISSRNPGGR